MGFPFSSVTANCFFAVKKHPCGIWHIVFGHSVFFCGSHKYRVIFFTSLFIISPPYLISVERFGSLPNQQIDEIDLSFSGNFRGLADGRIAGMDHAGFFDLH